jgi:hypothetical protein
MKKSLIFISAFFLIGCSTNNQNVQIEDNDEIAVCGEVAGEKQTYPTLGDLKMMAQNYYIMVHAIWIKRSSQLLV